MANNDNMDIINNNGEEESPSEYEQFRIIRQVADGREMAKLEEEDRKLDMQQALILQQKAVILQKKEMLRNKKTSHKMRNGKDFK